MCTGELKFDCICKFNSSNFSVQLSYFNKTISTENRNISRGIFDNGETHFNCNNKHQHIWALTVSDYVNTNQAFCLTIQLHYVVRVRNDILRNLWVKHIIMAVT